MQGKLRKIGKLYQFLDHNDSFEALIAELDNSKMINNMFTLYNFRPNFH